MTELERIHTQLDWFEENFKRINDKNERMV